MKKTSIDRNRNKQRNPSLPALSTSTKRHTSCMQWFAQMLACELVTVDFFFFFFVPRVGHLWPYSLYMYKKQALGRTLVKITK